ncbi:protoporphyrinogen oxidase [Nocardioides sp. GY 10127]|nr:protoporphyrinogen oxidase [Nocardioides sp. GY 10127]
MIVVGGGIAGLAAARELEKAGRSVLVLEGSPEVGGKLKRADVAGHLVDVGAEAMLNRRPEGVDLAAEVGLEVEHPVLARSRVWTRGELRPLPRSLMGVPQDTSALAASGILTPAEMERVLAEPGLPPLELADDEDVSVGELVDARFGHAVTDRLVEPLLGGVYAGHARDISARAAVPQLIRMAKEGSLLEAGRASTDTTASTYQAPVFAGIPGGMGLLPERLAAGLTVRTGAMVRGLERGAVGGWRLLVGPASHPEWLEADAVVLATPSHPAARLLADVAPVASRRLDAMEAASVAVVTFAFRAQDVRALDEMDASGFLVPPVDGHRIKASTWSFAKWGWVREAGAADGLAFLRTSLGRHREEEALQRSDEGLVALSRMDLHTAVDLTAEPVATHVQRWGAGLPQYAPGHLDAVAAVRADVAALPGLAVCGATYDGVGIPAVIASAQRAAREVLAPAGV